MTMPGGYTTGQRLLDRYEFVRHIADGGMGSVYEARDTALDRPVALKRVSFGGLSEAVAEQTRARTLREARFAAQLGGHRNVIAIYDVQQLDGDVWLVLEYLPSRSLADILDPGVTIDIGETARIGAGVAEALAAAHTRGITHRDVKPGNVLLSLDGRDVKLTDFGISHAEGELPLTALDVVSGTPAYMAREVARGDQETTASDVFSLGATLYRAVEGHPPFGDEPNPRKLLLRVANEPVTPPRRAGALAPLLMQLLELDPNTRPDAGGAQRLLDDFARRVRDPTQPPLPPFPSATYPPARPAPREPTSAAPGPAPDPATDPALSTAPRKRRRRLLVAAAAAVVVLALGAGLVAVLDRDDPTAVPELPESVQPLTLTGDYTAANPCAVLDPGVMNRFGTALIGPGSEVGKCRLTNNVAGPATSRTITEASYSNTQSDNQSTVGPEQSLGGVRIRRPGLTKTGCSTYILLSDRNFLKISTRLFSGTVGADSCEINQAAVAVAVDRLAENGITYTPDWQSDITLARFNACELAAEAPTLVPGVSARRTGYPNGAVCFVGDSSPGAPYAYVSLGLVPDGVMSQFGQSSTVNGKTVYTEPADPYNANPPACRVSLVHRPSFDGGATHPTEYIGVQLEGGAPYGNRCQQATALALAMEQRTT